MASGKFFVYIIRSSEGYTYTGMSDDPERRLEEHNNHTLSFWTKRGTDWKIIHTEEFETRSEALEREKWFKTGIGRKFVKSINK